jgi:hypothetical protein
MQATLQVLQQLLLLMLQQVKQTLLLVLRKLQVLQLPWRLLSDNKGNHG